MNNAKQYLFWIVSGGVLVLLLGIGFFWPVTASPDDGSTVWSPEEAKDGLDREIGELQKLSKRAKQEFQRPYNPQVPADLKDLTDKFLLTDKWKEVIDPHVAKYGQHLAAMREDLIQRSAPLRQEVTPNRDKLAWFIEYQKQSAVLVTRMRDAGALVGIDGDAAAADEALHPETGAKVRDLLGLLTTTTNPEPDEHRGLTKRLRAAEAICAAVLSSAIETRANPVVGDESAVPAAVPAIAAWEWRPDAGAEGLGDPIKAWASMQRCSVTLRGTESQLLSALARIESIASPVIITLGSTLGRIERGTGQIETGAPRVQLQIDLLVLDFTEMPDLAGGASAPPAPRPRAEKSATPTSTSTEEDN